MTQFSLKNLKESLDSGNFNSDEVKKIKNIATATENNYNDIIAKLKENDNFSNVEEFGKLEYLHSKNNEVLLNVAELEKIREEIVGVLYTYFKLRKTIDIRLDSDTDLPDQKFIENVLSTMDKSINFVGNVVTIVTDENFDCNNELLFKSTENKNSESKVEENTDNQKIVDNE